MAIREELGIDSRQYEQGLDRAERRTQLFGLSVGNVFRALGVTVTAVFVGRMVKSLTSYAAELQNVDSEARKAAGAIGHIATEQDIGRVAKMGEALEKFWSGLKLRGIVAISQTSVALTKFFTEAERRAEAIKQLQAELQIRTPPPAGDTSGDDRFRGAGSGFASPFASRANERVLFHARELQLIEERSQAIFRTQLELSDRDLRTREEKLRVEQRLTREQNFQLEKQRAMIALEALRVRNSIAEGNLEIQREERRRMKVIEEMQRLLGAQSILEDAADKYLRQIDRARLGFDQILGPDRESANIPSGVRQTARRVNRLEVRAQEAALRGNDTEAQRLLGQADALRTKIPGMKTTDLMDYAKTAAEKLANIDKNFAAVAGRFGVAQGGSLNLGGGSK